MYGYVVPPNQALTVEDFALYNSFYCGLCIRIGKLMGQRARLTTNYDITFLNVLIHDLLTQDVRFEAKNCVANPFKKHAIVCQNELLDKIAAVNVILAYHKAVDGVEDGEGLKYRLVRSSLVGAYKISKNMFPQAAETVANKYDLLRRYENLNTKGIDKVSDVFASMLADLAKLLLKDKANDDSVRLIYNIGKFVYLADALDDIDEDFKAKRYNPFLVDTPYNGREEFFNENKENLSFILNATINRAIECFNNLSFTQSYDLLRKIVHEGLRQKANEILGSKKKLKKPIVRLQK